MRVDALPFATANQAESKKPLYIIEIDFTDEILRLTGESGTPVPADGNDVEHGTFKVVSSTSQRIDPNIGASTIGGITFESIDLSDAITDKFRAKLTNDAIGLLGKTVTFKFGYDALAYTEFETVQTQQIRNVRLDGKKYIIACEDIQRAAKKQIFDEVKTTLAANITDTETTTMNVFDTTDFTMVQHGTSYSDAPSATVGYLEIKQGDKREVIRYTGKTSSTFTTLTRGVLGTRAQDFSFDSGGSDNGITVRQYVYLEMPVLKLAYALLTGDLIGQASQTLPDEWHLNIDPAWVDQSQFTAHEDLYDSTDDTAGFIARIEGVPRSDGKSFIEKELMLLAGTFMPVQADGSLGLKRMADVQPRAGYVGALDASNVIKYTPLEHAMDEVFNKVEIQWNYNTNRKEFSRINVLEDAASQATHGVTKTKILKFRALYGSIHSASILDTAFNVLRDRYAGPPLRISMTCLPSTNVFEVGDTVRVRLPIQDFTDTGTLDRTFEVQQRKINWLTGLVTFDLFSSSQRATLKTPSATSPLADAFYSSGLTAGNEINATNFPGNVASSAGITTVSGDITLNGNADMTNNAAIYWCTEPLTVNAGVTISVDRNVQLRVKGHITMNGDIDGIAAAVETGITGYCGAMVEAQWGLEIDGGGPVNDYYKSTNRSMVTPLQRSPLYGLIPFLNVGVDATGIVAGIPTDCRGISGATGGEVYQLDLLRKRAAGGAGGDGGAGLVIVSRGGSFGGSGQIDLSGGAGIKGSTHVSTGKTMHAGCGSPGGPGSCHWVVDGQASTIPTLSLNFIGKMGAVDLDGSTPDLSDWVKHPAPGDASQETSSAHGLNPARDENGPQDSTQVDISQSVQRVQVVSGFVEPNADVEASAPAPTSVTLTARANLPDMIISWADPSPIDYYDYVQVWRHTSNDFASASLLVDIRANTFTDTTAVAGTNYYYWVRSKKGVDYSSEVATTPTNATSAAITAASTSTVGGVSAATVAAAATNFNTSNDRNNAAITTPSVSGAGTAIDHVINTDGSADISFEWSWAGDEGIIDGFVVYHYTAAAGTSYNVGTTPAAETAYVIAAAERAFIFRGVAADQHHTFGIQAFRRVDNDIDTDGFIGSTVVQPALGAEDPYQPATSVAFNGNILGTIDSVPVATVTGGAAAGSKGIELNINVNNFAGTAQSGRFYLNGFDAAGVRSDVAGTVNIEGEPNHVMLGAVNEVQVTAVGVVNKKGWLAYDSADTTPFTLTIGRNIAFVFQDRDSNWFYADGTTTPISFTPTAAMYAIGTMQTHATTGLGAIPNASVFKDAIPLLEVPYVTVEIVADVLNSGTRTAVGDGTTLNWTWDNVNQSPVSTTQSVTVQFQDDQGTVKSSQTITFTFDGSVDNNSVIASNTASPVTTESSTVTLNHSGGGVNEGYETVKIVHDNTGVQAFVTATAISYGGYGGK